MDKIDEYLIRCNIQNGPETLSEAVERRIEDSFEFRADLIDFLSNALNEQIRKINITEFKYLGVSATDQYIESLASSVEFASKLYADLYALNLFSAAALSKIKEIEDAPKMEA